MPTLSNTTANVRMLKLIDKLKTNGVIEYRQEFLDVIGLKKQNFTRIISGNASFTVEHIQKACREYNINANWLLGMEKNIYR